MFSELLLVVVIPTVENLLTEIAGYCFCHIAEVCVFQTVMNSVCIKLVALTLAAFSVTLFLSADCQLTLFASANRNF